MIQQWTKHIPCTHEGELGWQWPSYPSKIWRVRRGRKGKGKEGAQFVNLAKITLSDPPDIFLLNGNKEGGNLAWVGKYWVWEASSLDKEFAGYFFLCFAPHLLAMPNCLGSQRPLLESGQTMLAYNKKLTSTSQWLTANSYACWETLQGVTSMQWVSHLGSFDCNMWPPWLE